uniref:NADH-ubiquinone oxidoreductase chain 2 n=1 Tax=Paranephrops planifrons TaxID=99774 RepID=A0A0A8WDU9_9EUCA|nr:NADH dehydrogenase subunit 2 [Paranephrops planifrons]CEK40189.1 NADH dehydrogenase subunit 2 [Paranephrops planifrons]
MSFPLSSIFYLTLISGSILSISSSSWFTAWIGLELNLMSFIPLISSMKNSLPSEASLKYFLIQALGSAIIIMSSTLSPLSLNFTLPLFSLALLLKLGAAPFHFWFPQVMEGLNWIQAIMLMTIQKLAPMFLLSYLTQNSFSNMTIFSSALICAMIGAVGGINQLSLRKIMAFSSINHMSWMLFAMLINETSWTIYFFLYSLISISVALLFLSLQSYYFSHLLNTNTHLFPKMISIMSLLSLGGLPPFSGFIPKWIIVQEMINQLTLFPLLILLTSSLITLYFYIRLSLSTISILTPLNKWNLSYKKRTLPSVPLMSTLNFFGLFLPSIFIFI